MTSEGGEGVWSSRASWEKVTVMAMSEVMVMAMCRGENQSQWCSGLLLLVLLLPEIL